MIQLVLDPNRAPFGVIAGKRMTRVSARPVQEVMRSLEAVETKDWFPLGQEVAQDGEGPFLTFAVAIDDLQWWVDHLGNR